MSQYESHRFAPCWTYFQDGSGDGSRRVRVGNPGQVGQLGRRREKCWAGGQSDKVAPHGEPRPVIRRRDPNHPLEALGQALGRHNIVSHWPSKRAAGRIITLWSHSQGDVDVPMSRTRSSGTMARRILGSSFRIRRISHRSERTDFFMKSRSTSSMIMTDGWRSRETLVMRWMSIVMPALPG